MMVLEFLLLPLLPLVLGWLGWEVAGWGRPPLGELLKSLGRLPQPRGRPMKSSGQVRLLQFLSRLVMSPSWLLQPPGRVLKSSGWVR